MAVGLEKKGGGRKKRLGFDTAQAHHPGSWLEPAVMTNDTRWFQPPLRPQTLAIRFDQVTIAHLQRLVP